MANPCRSLLPPGVRLALVAALVPASTLAAEEAATWTRLAVGERSESKGGRFALRFAPVEVSQLRILLTPPAAAPEITRTGEITCLNAYSQVRPSRVETDEAGMILRFAKPVSLSQVRVAGPAEGDLALTAIEVQGPAAETAKAAAPAARASVPGKTPAAARGEVIPESRLESLGEYRVTCYYVAEEKNYEGEADTDVLDPGGKVLARVPAKFADFMHIQGCGKLKDGRVLTYVSNKRYVVSKAPYGRGVGYDLEPFRSLAVDKTIIPLGTKLFIKEFVGAPLPDGRVHDGVFYAQDTGGGIKGTHIDLFAGVKEGTAVVARQGIHGKVNLYRVKE